MMAEMIATYSAPGHERRSRDGGAGFGAGDTGPLRRPLRNAPSGGGYLNEVRSVSAAPRQD